MNFFKLFHYKNNLLEAIILQNTCCIMYLIYFRWRFSTDSPLLKRAAALVYCYLKIWMLKVSVSISPSPSSTLITTATPSITTSSWSSWPLPLSSALRCLPCASLKPPTTSLEAWTVWPLDGAWPSTTVSFRILLHSSIFIILQFSLNWICSLSWFIFLNLPFQLLIPLPCFSRPLCLCWPMTTASVSGEATFLI